MKVVFGLPVKFLNCKTYTSSQHLQKRDRKHLRRRVEESLKIRVEVLHVFSDRANYCGSHHLWANTAYPTVGLTVGLC